MKSSNSIILLLTITIVYVTSVTSLDKKNKVMYNDGQIVVLSDPVIDPEVLGVWNEDIDLNKFIPPISDSEIKCMMHVDRYCSTSMAHTKGAAPDWTLMMDMYEKHCKIPGDVGVSSSRPDLFLYSKHLRRVILVEITIPWETNIPKDHTFKLNKYYELTSELFRNKFIVSLSTVEVGAKGLLIKALTDDCENCTIKEKESVGKIVASMWTYDSQLWKLFLKRFDSTGSVLQIVN